MATGKYLMSEYFKFQKKGIEHSENLSSSCQLTHLISHLACHASDLKKKVKSKVDIEPVLLVYFSNLTKEIKSKDSLSKVSKTFFKEVKMNYRELQKDLSAILIGLSHFFTGHESVTVLSFWQFMVLNLCTYIAEEHAHFVFTILKDRAFTDQTNLQKFQGEILIFNELMWVLFHCNFEYNAYMAVRALRDVQFKVKKFCEGSDNKIERALQRAITNEQRQN
jgi:hypothetical protein